MYRINNNNSLFQSLLRNKKNKIKLKIHNKWNKFHNNLKNKRHLNQILCQWTFKVNLLFQPIQRVIINSQRHILPHLSNSLNNINRMYNLTINRMVNRETLNQIVKTSINMMNPNINIKTLINQMLNLERYL